MPRFACTVVLCPSQQFFAHVGMGLDSKRFSIAKGMTKSSFLTSSLSPEGWAYNGALKATKS